MVDTKFKSVLEGIPDISARRKDGFLVTAKEALAAVNIFSITFGSKEALGLVNGTAPSAALASMVVYDAHQLAVLVQALTAMAAEAMQVNAESFHPFIALFRPHEGQIEASRNILGFLQESAFAPGIQTQKNRNPTSLAQDRYALRSSPQWIGPQLEGASRLDVIRRFDKIVEQALPVLLQALERSLPETAPKLILGVIQVWGQSLRQRLAAKYQEIFNQFQKAPDTTEYLGVGGRPLYSVIRNELKDPFHLGVTDHPVGFDDHGESKRTRRTVHGFQ
ncbi:phenylalanine aminomutase (L-beta-phenylalanine forming) [Colletotrichum liriopes]|uniref:Phenylalanine aminomutase (L-beta-phenylalanine forming) n=1 Tax=Colletotrichum liriopes TaxID=708192 RepID=A0AA37LZD4_9PEZI|nr:phenylalanine aminomutase (L-beta-phenylalanine forming) [Colletotrichum liriopes]